MKRVSSGYLKGAAQYSLNGCSRRNSVTSISINWPSQRSSFKSCHTFSKLIMFQKINNHNGVPSIYTVETKWWVLLLNLMLWWRLLYWCLPQQYSLFLCCDDYHKLCSKHHCLLTFTAKRYSEYCGMVFKVHCIIFTVYHQPLICFIDHHMPELTPS